MVRLDPLTFRDAERLSPIGSDAAIWTYLTADAETPRAMQVYVSDLLNQWRSGTALPFTVSRRSDEALLGVVRLKEVCRRHRRATVGSWFARSAWGTGVNTEAKRLLLGYAFERLGLLRIEFQTDAQNVRSRVALGRLGIREEGVLRRHQLRRDATRRDTVVFGVIADEWPTVRATIDTRLDAQVALR